MAGARKASRDDKRRRIVDAAVEVFAAKGFYSAKISEIADAAGVADGTIYLYFESKDDILVSLFREKMGEILEQFTAMLAEEEDPERKIRRYVEGHLALVASQPKLMQVLTVELRQSERFMKEHAGRSFARYLALLAGIIDSGQKTGIFRKDLHPFTLSRVLFGAIDEIARAWVLGGGPEAWGADRVRVGTEVSDFILRGLRS